jgi:ribosome-associated protein
LESRDLARTAAHAAIDKKARDVIILDIAAQTVIADFFVICTGGNRTHVQAIADGIDEKVEAAGGRRLRIEGYQKGGWILLDYGAFVVHVFSEEERDFYNLERLWGDAEQVQL